MPYQQPKLLQLNMCAKNRQGCKFPPGLKDAFQSVQSQHPNVYINIKVSLDGMQIDVICYKPHTLSLRYFKSFFQQLH